MVNAAAGRTLPSPFRIALARLLSPSGRGATCRDRIPTTISATPTRIVRDLDNGVVRLEPADGRLAEDEPEAACDRRSEDVAAEEGDAVRPGTRAPDDEERRRQGERAGGGGQGVDEDMTAGADHATCRPSVAIRARSYAFATDAPGTPAAVV